MVNVEQCIPIEHGDRFFLTMLQSIDYGSASAQRRHFAGIVYSHSIVFIVEELLDLLVHIACCQHDVAIALRCKTFYQPAQEWATRHRCHGLGYIADHMAQACAEAPGKYYRFHFIS